MTDKLLRYFSAGAAGGLLNSIVVWLFGFLGITAALSVAISPRITPGWLYPRIVWGGIWGLLLFLPLCRRNAWARAFLLSLVPTAVQLFIVFPLKAGKGVGGIELGSLTPLFVVLFNFVWGGTAVFLSRSYEQNSV
ncbi:MAG: hypothetical protein ACE5HC_10880 [Candidatus Binatia bacterium]